jgi:hypothetical protein
MPLHHERGEMTSHPMAALWHLTNMEEGNIIDHVIAAFVSPFTSDGAVDLGLNQEPGMTLV